MDVVAVEVVVSQWLMNVLVRVPLAQVQPYADGHQQARVVGVVDHQYERSGAHGPWVTPCTTL
jgi:hypothetical protein